MQHLKKVTALVAAVSAMGLCAPSAYADESTGYIDVQCIISEGALNGDTDVTAEVNNHTLTDAEYTVETSFDGSSFVPWPGMPVSLKAGGRFVANQYYSDADGEQGVARILGQNNEVLVERQFDTADCEPPSGSPTEVIRIYGDDRYETTAALVERYASANGGRLPVVFVSTGENYADAMAASAGSLDGSSSRVPVLLTRTNSIPMATRALLAKYRPIKIVVVGGETAVSSAVEDSLAQYGEVSRIAGQNRYETAALVAEQRGVQDTVFLANGTAWADSLSGAPLARSQGGSLLLTRHGSTPLATLDAIQAVDAARIVALGGSSQISDAQLESLRSRGFSVERIAGSDRYETAALINQQLDELPELAVATGLNYPDPLTAGALSPVALTRPTSLPAPLVNLLVSRHNEMQAITVVGGSASVSQAVLERIVQLAG